ncbi:MAG: lysoplasmalogenase [Chitinophagaceae bacterium]|nr:MAG: lysoplasmalogenase [Chitinophagaceae bacterium]
MAIISGHAGWRLVSKPLLMPLLAAGYFSQVKTSDEPKRLFVPAALFFSWLGDIFLLFEGKTLFFMFGLSSFLVAHVFYLIFFNEIIRHRSIKRQAIWLLPVLAYYFFLMWLLGSGPGPLVWPVRLYGHVICLMLFNAIRIPGTGGKHAWQMLAGALLFVLSDSILAIDRFHQPLANAGFLIMLTYGMAQWLITAGSAGWLRKSEV